MKIIADPTTAVNEIKDVIKKFNKALIKIREMKTEDAFRVYYQVRLAYDEIDEAKTELGKLVNTLTTSTMPEILDDADLPNITLKDLEKMFVRTENTSVKMKDKEAAFAWLKKQGDQDLIQETINSSALKGYVNQMIRDGKTPPDEIFDVTTSPLIAIRSATSKK